MPIYTAKSTPGNSIFASPRGTNLLHALKSAKKKAASGIRALSPRSAVKRDVARDVVAKDWEGPINTPKKKKEKINLQYDRFIPNREAMSASSSHHSLSSRRSTSSEDTTNHSKDLATLVYEEEVANACGVTLDKRILAFKAEPPSCDVDDIRAQYNRPIKHQMVSQHNRRRILTAPERVLDAPGLLDDYYLNLLDWSCDNNLAIGLDSTVYVWNAGSGDVASLVQMREGEYVCSLKWSADGSYLAVGRSDGDVQIWDIETQQKIRTMSGHNARIPSLSWDKHILSSGCRDGSIWHHDVRIAQHKIAELRGHSGEVCGLTWRNDGLQLASGGNDNTVNIWDARSSVPKFTKTNHTAAVKALAWCPFQNNLLASGGGSYDKHIHFWNTTTGARLNSLNTGSQVTSIIWSKEYKEFASCHGYPDNNISVWTYPTLGKVIDIPAHETRVLHATLSPDGQMVATGASDENLKFFRLFEKQSTKGKPLGIGLGKGKDGARQVRETIR